MRSILTLFVASLFVASLCTFCSQALAADATAPRPNILFIMADDIGWGDFQCYNPDGEGPRPTLTGWPAKACGSPRRIRRPLCVHQRVTRWPPATTPRADTGPGGTWGWNQTPQFLPHEKTVGHLLQAAGYRTALFGKLHFGGNSSRSPAGDRTHETDGRDRSSGDSITPTSCSAAIRPRPSCS